MKYIVMIHDVNDVKCRGDITSYLWYGRINSKFFHVLRKHMAEIFEARCRAYPFANGWDLAATILNARGEQEPIYSVYGGYVACDIWEMYTGSIVHGTYKLAHWQRAMSPAELKDYLTSKYGRLACYSDTDSVRGGDPN